MSTAAPRTRAVEVARWDPGDPTCAFCHQGADTGDVLKSGKLFSVSGVRVHYFCVLFR